MVFNTVFLNSKLIKISGDYPALVIHFECVVEDKVKFVSAFASFVFSAH
jgi:hypothetical protein